MDQEHPLINAIINEVNEIKDISNVCSLCNKSMENNQPIIELLCHHKFHTQCFLIRCFNDYQPECKTCKIPIFTQELRDESQEYYTKKQSSKEDNLMKKLQSNPAAKLDLKLVKKQLTAAKKSQSVFRKFFTQMRDAHKEESRPLKKLLKDMLEKRKKSLKESDEFKNWKKEKIKLLRYINVFNQKYADFTFHELAIIKSLKLPTRWELRRIIRFNDYYFYRMMDR